VPSAGGGQYQLSTRHPKQSRRSGLPAELSSLVGRGPLIAAVLERLQTAPLVTLTGPGGCGKTRVDLRVAMLAEAAFGDRAHLAELPPLTDPDLVPACIADALDMPERDATNPTASLARALADRCRRLACLKMARPARSLGPRPALSSPPRRAR